MTRYFALWRLSTSLRCCIATALAGMVLAACAADAFAQITVGGNGGDTTDSTAYSGNQSLTKVGSNIVTLTGNNTYTGSTFVNQGILKVGNDGTTGTLGSGNVTNNATLAFARSVRSPYHKPSPARVWSGSGGSAP